MNTSPPVVAAGAVVSRKNRGKVEVLLVHRPKYGDWSFPKGKLDPGEDPCVAAVREVAEETGLDIRLGPPLRPQHYLVGNGTVRPKVVHYWVGRLIGKGSVAKFRPNAEIDAVRWLPVEKARSRLTYPRDRDTLAEALRFRKRSAPLVVLRHSQARSRKSWRGDDRKRPLNSLGQLQSERLVAPLAAYGVQRVVTSSSRRCTATVTPYADVAKLQPEVTEKLSEEDASADSVTAEVGRLLDSGKPAVLCTHRPVLPWVFSALGIDPPSLAPGAFVVVHHRKRRIVTIEHHLPPLGR